MIVGNGRLKAGYWAVYFQISQSPLCLKRFVRASVVSFAWFRSVSIRVHPWWGF